MRTIALAYLFVAVGDMIYADGYCRRKGRLANAQIVGPVGLTTRADAPPGLAVQMPMEAVREVAAEVVG